MSDIDLIKTKSYLASNPNCWFEIRWLGQLLLIWLASTETKHPECSMAGDKGSSSAAYGAPNATTFPPTWSRRLGDFVLLTFSGENCPREAGDVEATWAVFNSGGGSFRWCSCFRNCSGGGSGGRASSSKRRINSRSSGEADRRRWLA
jgi:hypothetical protein